MSTMNYEIRHRTIEQLLEWIKNGKIAVPQIQRSFVWKPAQVRDFIDSLYSGYPVGYLITWVSPTMQLKDGTTSKGKRILIDGQQRLISLQTALLGDSITDSSYRKKRITIAFNPTTEQFEISKPALRKDHAWISDIAPLFSDSDNGFFTLLDEYCDVNPKMKKPEIFGRLERVRDIRNNNLGLIELSEHLDIETIAEIFKRINSMGAKLTAADFVMSKIAASENYNGPILHKCISYFCHMAKVPNAYSELATDSEFTQTPYFRAMEWLKGNTDRLYIPEPKDILRVSITSEFQRGKFDDLVTLLSGRVSNSRRYEESVAEKSFHRLGSIILRYMNKTNFTRFIMILRSAGFVFTIKFQNSINFAYSLYLILQSKSISPERIETLVRRWFVMSLLTNRYTGVPDSKYESDIRSFINEENPEQYLNVIELVELSGAFWDIKLPQQMDNKNRQSSYFRVFQASQIKENDKGFLSKDHTVQILLEGTSHIHHIFPKKYLQKNGLNKPEYYNQIANLVIMQGETNMAIGNKAPYEYFRMLKLQVEDGTTRYGGITDANELKHNFNAHCIPEGMEVAHIDHYNDFLHQRRILMATKIHNYYESL